MPLLKEKGGEGMEGESRGMGKGREEQTFLKRTVNYSS